MFTSVYFWFLGSFKRFDDWARQVMRTAIIFSFFILSLSAHQEPRFLLPLMPMMLIAIPAEFIKVS